MGEGSQAAATPTSRAPPAPGRVQTVVLEGSPPARGGPRPLPLRSPRAECGRSQSRAGSSRPVRGAAPGCPRVPGRQTPPTFVYSRGGRPERAFGSGRGSPSLSCPGVARESSALPGRSRTALKSAKGTRPHCLTAGPSLPLTFSGFLGALDRCYASLLLVSWRFVLFPGFSVRFSIWYPCFQFSDREVQGHTMPDFERSTQPTLGTFCLS